MARSSRTFATMTSSPSSCRCSLVQIEIRFRLHNLTVWKRRLRLGSATRSHFPAPPRRLEPSHRSLQRGSKDERTVTTACPQPAVTNGPQRPTSFKRTDTRATHSGQENYSPPQGRIHLRRLVFSTKLFPWSRAADHTFVTVSNRPAEMGGGGRKAAADREETSSLPYTHVNLAL